MNHAVTLQQANKECENNNSILPSGVDKNERVTMVTQMKDRRLNTVWLSLRLENWINKTTSDCIKSEYHINVNYSFEAHKLHLN